MIFAKTLQKKVSLDRWRYSRHGYFKKWIFFVFFLNYADPCLCTRSKKGVINNNLHIHHSRRGKHNQHTLQDLHNLQHHSRSHRRIGVGAWGGRKRKLRERRTRTAKAQTNINRLLKVLMWRSYQFEHFVGSCVDLCETKSDFTPAGSEVL
jgi:hypothetical protein